MKTTRYAQPAGAFSGPFSTVYFVGLLLLGLAGCASGLENNAALGQPCVAGQCADGLICLEGICVEDADVRERPDLSPDDLGVDAPVEDAAPDFELDRSVDADEEVAADGVEEPDSGGDDAVGLDSNNEPDETDADDAAVEVEQFTCQPAVGETRVTVFDATPEEGGTIESGFDPLQGGDVVRIVVEVDALDGRAPFSLNLTALNLQLDATSVRLDGVSLVLTDDEVGDNWLRLALPAEIVAGRLQIDGVTQDPEELVGVDAWMTDVDTCTVAGSSSGARLQIAGHRDPIEKHCLSVSEYRSLQITTDIPDKSTSVYSVRNGQFDLYPYKILHQVTLCLRRDDERVVSLSGSADGTRPWMVDNVLMIETFDSDPELGGVRLGAYLVGGTLSAGGSSLSDGTPITVVALASMPGDLTGGISPGRFSYPPGVVQLNDMMPQGVDVWLRFTGLDEGVVGRLTRIFINSAKPGEVVAECRSYLDCPSPSAGATSTSVRSGCIDGVCTPVSCAGGTGCPAGQRCVADYCTLGCNADYPCPGEEVCTAGYCADLTDPTECRTYADCPEGQLCFFGECMPGCFHPVHQQSDYGDNYYTSLCSTSPDACPRCGTASDTCWNTYCRDCEIDQHCATGEVCADFECVSE